uniref:Uncharacterized protein n=1 Tax=Oryza brachyantha TaxID=4533 RepID=J3MSU3_ORYBR
MAVRGEAHVDKPVHLTRPAYSLERNDGLQNLMACMFIAMLCSFAPLILEPTSAKKTMTQAWGEGGGRFLCVHELYITEF